MKLAGRGALRRDHLAGSSIRSSNEMRVSVALRPPGVAAWQSSGLGTGPRDPRGARVAIERACDRQSKTTNAAPLKGTVLVKLGGARASSSWPTANTQVPAFGLTFDMSEGTVASATPAGAGKDSARELNGGQSGVQQSRQESRSSLTPADWRRFSWLQPCCRWAVLQIACRAGCSRTSRAACSRGRNVAGHCARHEVDG